MNMISLEILSTLSFFTITNATELEFGFNKINTNNFIADGYIGITDISSVCKCSVTCIQTPGCVTYGFSTKTQHRECYLYNYHVNLGSNGTSVSGLAYYSRLPEKITATTSLSTTTMTVSTAIQLSLEARCNAAAYTFESGINFCYKFYLTKLVWSDALVNCHADGGILAHMFPVAKFTFIRDIVLAVWSFTLYDNGIFIGVYYDENLGYWAFSKSTKPMPNNYWVGGAPATSNTGECAYFSPLLHTFGVGSGFCANAYAYICEII